MKALATAAVMAAMLVPGTAQDLPGAVKKGLDRLAEGKYEVAVDAWIENSSLTDREAKQFTEALDNAEEVLGRPTDYEVVQRVALTERAQQIYVAVYYEKGMCWFKFNCVKPAKGEWICANFIFNTTPEAILPAWFIEARKK